MVNVMRKSLFTVILITFMLLVNVAVADPQGVSNSKSNPDTTGFTVSVSPDIIKIYDNGTYVDYTDPKVMVKMTFTNTIPIPDIYVDESEPPIVYNTYNFNDYPANTSAITINGETHVLFTINTSNTETNSINVPPGVTESKSGVWHYASIVMPDGRIVKFWVVDTITAGVYDKVFVDIDADKIIDVQNLVEGNYFDYFLNDNYGSQMRIVVYNISDDGSFIQIYNKWDNLQVNDPSPIGTGKLRELKQPHWVVYNYSLAGFGNVTKVDILKEVNGEYVLMNSTSDYIEATLSNNIANIVILLGDWQGENGEYVSAVRDVYLRLHLQPVVDPSKDIVKTVTSKTQMYTITLHNDNKVTIEPGYIKIEGVVPIDGYEQVASTIKVNNQKATVEVLNETNSVSLLIKYNDQLSPGETVTLTITYEYAEPIYQILDDIRTTVNNMSGTLNLQDQKQQLILQRISNITAKMDEIYNTIVAMNQSQGDVVDLTNIETKIDALSTSVDNIAQDISILSDRLSTIEEILTGSQSGQEVTVSAMNMMSMFEISNYIQQLTAKANALIQDNSTSTYIKQEAQGILAELQKLNTIATTIQAQNTLEGGLEVVMLYNRLNAIEVRLSILESQAKEVKEISGIVSGSLSTRDIMTQLQELKLKVNVIDSKVTQLSNMTAQSGGTEMSGDLMSYAIIGLAVVLIVFGVMRMKRGKEESPEEEEFEEFSEEELGEW